MEQPNLTYIQQLSGGEKQFEDKLIGIIKSEFPEEKSNYLQSLKSKDYLKASEHVHKIKHKISILGLEKSYDIAGDHENNLRENNIDLKDEFETIMQVMIDFLENL